MDVVRRKHMSKYQKVWIENNHSDIPEGYHIHHLDGNRKNNDIDNLLCVSPSMHYEIHFALWNRYGKKKDLCACVFLKKEIDNPKKLPSPNKGVKMSKDAREKMSKAKKGKASWNKGLKMSEEARMNMSKARKGVKHSEERKLNFSKSRIGLKTSKAKPFYYYGEFYRTTREFSNKTGKSRTYIYDRLKDINNKNVFYA